VKNCTKCGTPASDELKFCGECGHQFSFVSDDLPSTDIAQGNADAIAQSQPPTSPWIKVGVLCVILLAAMFGWQQFTTSKLADCRSQALQTNSLGRVLDIRLDGTQCEYLIEMSTFGIGTPVPAEWWPQSSFENLLLTRAEDAPNQ
jgi:hypothetical protein